MLGRNGVRLAERCRQGMTKTAGTSKSLIFPIYWKFIVNVEDAAAFVLFAVLSIKFRRF
jgi:hypothetical protein